MSEEKVTRKRIPMEKQIATISKMLILWPNCPNEAMKRYVKNKLGVSMSRVCLQKAKEALGLGKPEHLELTQKKQQYAHYVMLGLMAQFGIGGLTERGFYIEVGKALEKKFKQSTNSQLVRGWVSESLNEYRGSPSDFPQHKAYSNSVCRFLKTLANLA